MNRRILIPTALLLAATIGCEPEAPPAEIVAPAAPEVVSIDQQARVEKILLISPRLTIQAPESWSMESGSVGVMLEGKTPAGRTLLSVNKIQLRMSAAQVEAIAARVQTQVSTTLPSTLPADGPFSATRIWKKGESVFIEEIVRSDTPITLQRPGKDQLPEDYQTRVLKWKVTAYIRDSLDFQLVELRLVDVPEAQFQADRDFLRGLFDTLALPQ